jgi:CBS domain-containing protein
VMSSPAVTARETDDVDTIKRLMETRQIRRVPVVGSHGEICGIVSLADVARRETQEEVGEVVKEVSAPTR